MRFWHATFKITLKREERAGYLLMLLVTRSFRPTLWVQRKWLTLRRGRRLMCFEELQPQYSPDKGRAFLRHSSGVVNLETVFLARHK